MNSGDISDGRAQVAIYASDPLNATSGTTKNFAMF